MSKLLDSLTDANIREAHGEALASLNDGFFSTVIYNKRALENNQVQVSVCRILNPTDSQALVRKTITMDAAEASKLELGDIYPKKLVLFETSNPQIVGGNPIMINDVQRTYKGNPVRQLKFFVGEPINMVETTVDQILGEIETTKEVVVAESTLAQLNYTIISPFDMPKRIQNPATSKKEAIGSNMA